MDRVRIRFMNTRVVVLMVCVVVLGGGLIGCGQKVVMQKATMINATDDERQQIKGYLEKAGISGDIQAIVSQDDRTWIVSVSAPKPKTGKVVPVPPNDYLVDKATGKVTAGQAPGAQ